MTDWPYPRWVAHRGAGKLAPENTLAAFEFGARHGYRMFECDVKLSADDVLFLLHDATLGRTTNGQGQARAQSWQELSQLDAGSWHSAGFAGQRLASFEAIARHCRRFKTITFDNGTEFHDYALLEGMRSANHILAPTTAAC